MHSATASVSCWNAFPVRAEVAVPAEVPVRDEAPEPTEVLLRAGIPVRPGMAVAARWPAAERSREYYAVSK